MVFFVSGLIALVLKIRYTIEEDFDLENLSEYLIALISSLSIICSINLSINVFDFTQVESFILLQIIWVL